MRHCHKKGSIDEENRIYIVSFYWTSQYLFLQKNSDADIVSEHVSVEEKTQSIQDDNIELTPPPLDLSKAHVPGQLKNFSSEDQHSEYVWNFSFR